MSTPAGFIRKGESLFENMLKTKRHRQNTWSDAKFILADVPLDKKAVKKSLPLFMCAGKKPKATLFICHYPDVAYPLVPYHEAAMLIHVRTPLGKGIHCSWMIVDDDTALILGREWLGYPKKLGVFEFHGDGDKARASISRRGIQVMEMTAQKKERQEPPPHVFNCKTFNIGAMGQFGMLNPIWLFKPHEVINESYSANIHLELNDSPLDPLSRLIAGEPFNGRIVTMDITGGSSYLLPVGITGPFLFNRLFNMRFR